MRHRLRRRTRRERGAAALEFGLVSPIIFAVLFGTITYGLWFNDSMNLRQGLRDASRQGVVASYGDTTSCDMPLTATTPPATDNIKKLMCTAKREVGAMTGPTYVRVLLPGGWVRGQPVVVCGMTKAERLPGIVPLPDDRMIRWQSRMSIERVTPGQVEVGGEAVPPSGVNWSWCTA
jgi:Flp pilus assembly pilin Flp